jgi:hypothetical protein
MRHTFTVRLRLAPLEQMVGELAPELEVAEGSRLIVGISTGDEDELEFVQAAKNGFNLWGG